MRIILPLFCLLIIASLSINTNAINYNAENKFIQEDTTEQHNLSSYELYKGDTINRINEKGFRVGLWYVFPDSTSEFTVKYFRTGETGKFSDNLWTKSYYPNGVIRSHWVRDTTLNYFENGNLKTRDIRNGYLGGVIEYYYESGPRERTCFSSLKWKTSGVKTVSDIIPTRDSCHCWLESGEFLKNCP